MTFHEKLGRLMYDRKEVVVNEEAGLEQGYVGGCLGAGAEPGGFKVFKLARYFEVGVEWFLDDARGWESRRAPELDLSPEHLEILQKLVPALLALQLPKDDGPNSPGR